MTYWTTETFKEKMKTVNPDLEIISEYVKAVEPITYHCLKCGYTGTTTPNSLLSGRGCANCVHAVKYTPETFKARVAEKFPELELLEDVINANTKIKYRCKKCGAEQERIAYRILTSKFGCRKCAKNMKRTTQGFIEEMKTINPTITILGEYVNARTHILCKCNIDGTEWSSIPYSLTKGGLCCPTCRYKSVSAHKTKSNSQFITDLKKINPYIEPLEEYVDNNTKIKVRCKDCNIEWFAQPSKLLINRGCPRCRTTQGERVIRLYLDEHNIKYEFNKTFTDLRGTKGGIISYDFYVPTYKLLIEFQGEQHYNPITFGGISTEQAEQRYNNQVEHDKLKQEYATANQFNLLVIPYWEYKNIHEILDNTLTSY